jgi:hypothetical protein
VGEAFWGTVFHRLRGAQWPSRYPPIGEVRRIMLYLYVATSPSPTDARHLVFKNFEMAGTRVTERRFAARDITFRRLVPTQ